MKINFTKMHGCGNDFVVIDLRQPVPQNIFTSAKISELANYKKSIGFDQLLLVNSSKEADIAIQIFNNDGQEVEACGNGSRCVASLYLDKRSELSIATKDRILYAKWQKDLVAINMGEARVSSKLYNFDELIPKPILNQTNEFQDEDAQCRLLHEHSRDPQNSFVSLKMGNGITGYFIDMGNPHIVIDITNCSINEAKNIFDKYGPLIEKDPRFPHKVNVNFIKIIDKDTVSLRTWERGAGATLACGTGACASFALLNAKKLVNNSATIKQAGGDLVISIDMNEIIMAGEAKISYQGIIEIK